MPPKPPPNKIVSSVVKAAAAASKTSGPGVAVPGVGGATTTKQPPKKKKQVVKAKRPGSAAAVAIGKDDTLHPKNPKVGVMKSRPATAPSSSSSVAAGGGGAADAVQFSSQLSSSAPPSSKVSAGGGASKMPFIPPVAPVTPAVTAQQVQQFKLERAQIARRDLAEMDAIERAFREDANVWNGPANVVFPKRYHAVGGSDEKGEKDGAAAKREGGKDGDNQRKRSPIDNPYVTFYGSQSQGWMYGEGLAGIGGRSWIEATSEKPKAPAVDDKAKEKADATTDAKQKEDDGASSAPSSFLVDDVTIIDNALRANGLTRNDVTPKAYACLLEQGRRFALELLANAQEYAVHAQRNSIPALLPADLILAAEMGEEDGGGVHGVPSTLPSPEEISDLASEVNRVPLPPIPSHCYNGVALPPVEQQLTARTYDVVNGARAAQRMMRGGDLPLTKSELDRSLSSSGSNSKKDDRGSGKDDKGPRKKTVGSYGAGKGRQIAVHIKSGSKASGLGAKGASAAAGKSTMAAKPDAKKGQKRTLVEL